MRATAAIVSQATGEDLQGMDEPERAALLRRLLSGPGLPGDMPENLPEESRKVLDTFERIRLARDEFSETPVETFVLSMAHHASDVLCVQLLARRAGLLEVGENGQCTANHLRVTPLFETVDDLKRLRVAEHRLKQTGSKDHRRQARSRNAAMRSRPSAGRWAGCRLQR